MPPVRPPIVRRGFGLLELATMLALLVIVMGLTVSLARYVRAASAEQITRQLLRRLNDALAKQAEASVPPLPEPVPGPPIRGNERDWADYARRSAETVRQIAGLTEPVVDAWGNPIGYLAAQRPQIGMAPYDRPFCFSAGPDGRFLTQDDNLYSYEQLSLLAPAATQPGGHGE